MIGLRKSTLIKIAEFGRDRAGNIAIMTALTLPVLLLAMLGGTTVMKAMTDRRALQDLAQAACNRAVKPQRLMSMDDSTRTKHAEELFDALAKERGITLASKSVTSSWLTATVTAAADIQPVPGLGEQVNFRVSVEETCTGIPPYPAKGEVILSSNFKTPSGTKVDLPYSSGSGNWGVFTQKQIGWDGGDGWGVELQDWAKGFDLEGGHYKLPAGVSNTFVVELDSGPMPGQKSPASAQCGMKSGPYNSSMFKTFELHPGTYRISLWFFPRVPVASDKDRFGLPHTPANSTNRIAVYLEGTRPVSAKTLKLEFPSSPIPNPKDLIQAWQKRSFDINVTNYGLYKLHIAAEGCSDGSGGLFNDLKLEYVQRPSPEYNDPAPPATN